MFLVLRTLTTLLFLLLALASQAIPENFTLDILTDQVPQARQMAEAKNGVIFVGSFGAGKVYAVEPTENLNAKPTVTVVAEGLMMPTGLALFEDDLYVAALNRILRFDDILNTYTEHPTPVVVTNQLPRDRHHGWKYLSVGPDNHLYFNVGAPCNICKREEEIYASIVRLNPVDGSMSVYAHGIRNTVGLAWHPDEQQLWFSDNGGDNMGDDIPAEEINVVTEPGQHFGYPHVHQGDLLDRRFGEGFSVDEFEPPVVKIQAHSAAIGIDFYTGTKFPAKYKNALFIAEHGSWNRSSKVGYRVSVVHFENSEPAYKPFIDIWLKDGQVSGRPADVLATQAGDLLISDDHEGRIYKVTYD